MADSSDDEAPPELVPLKQPGPVPERTQGEVVSSMPAGGLTQNTDARRQVCVQWIIAVECSGRLLATCVPPFGVEHGPWPLPRGLGVAAGSGDDHHDPCLHCPPTSKASAQQPPPLPSLKPTHAPHEHRSPRGGSRARGGGGGGGQGGARHHHQRLSRGRCVGCQRQLGCAEFMRSLLTPVGLRGRWPWV
jgi:hypothetical protein